MVDTTQPEDTSAVSLESIANGIQETQNSISIILGLVQSIDSRLAALEGQNAERQTSVVIEQANTISHLSSRVTLLRERLAAVEEVASARVAATGRKRRAREVVTLDEGDDDDAEPSSSRPRLNAAASASPQVPRRLIAGGSDTQGAAENSDKPARNQTEDKGKTLAECLVAVSKAGCVSQANMKTVKLPPGLGEDASARPRIKNVLELADYVMTQEERNVLMRPDNESQLIQTALEIEARAMRKMAILEGRDPDKKPWGKRQKPFIIGLGTRVRNYKKMIFDSGNYLAKDPNATSRGIPLKEREDVIADARREGKLHLIRAPRGGAAAAVAEQEPVTPSGNADEGSADGAQTSAAPAQLDDELIP